MAPQRPVVAGVDGSAASLAAADLAAAEAVLRGVPLELVHGFAAYLAPIGVPPDLPGVTTGPTIEELRSAAERVLHDAASRVRDTYPDLPVVTRLRDGPPAAVLTTASGHAALLVVGGRGAGGFTELLTGSVGVQLASHARCPVLIVRGRAHEGGSVVVGVDGSAGAARAARFAAEAAERYRTGLVALFAWPRDPAWSPELVQAGFPPPEVPEEVDRTVAELARAHPEVEIQTRVERERPAHEALIAASEQARLVVAGARGLGGFQGLLLGSVSQALIHHSRCPVAVVGPESTLD